MKRFITYLLLITTLALTYHTCAFANNEHDGFTQYNIEYISDSYYIESYIIEENNTTNLRSVNTKTASKIHNIKNSDGETLASFKVTGTFQYTGSTSNCTLASYSTSIKDSTWKFTSTSASKSGNSAIGNFTAKQYLFGIVMQTLSKTVTLTCDKNGNLSQLKIELNAPIMI